MDVWALGMEGAVALPRAMDRLRAAVSTERADRPVMMLSKRVGDVAVLSIQGMMMANWPPWASSLATNTSLAREEINALASDQEVNGVILHVSSGGGEVGGVDELALEVARLRTAKPVVAFVDGVSASAAYWATSQANSIVMNRTGMVGSIGVYAVLYDTSALAEAAGVKVLVMQSGADKPVYEDGVPVSDGLRAMVKARVEQIHGFFRQAVIEGRGLTAEQAVEVTTGRVFLGADAVKAGLVDEIGGMAEAMGRLRGLMGAGKVRRGMAML